MTNEKLAEIAARCEKATPGPWFVHHDGTRSAETARAYVTSQEEDTAHSLFDSMNRGYKESGLFYEADEDGQYWYDERGHADLTFCAHARADIPALLDHVREQETQLAAVTKELATEQERSTLRYHAGQQAAEQRNQAEQRLAVVTKERDVAREERVAFQRANLDIALREIQMRDQRDALAADNARLRDALEAIADGEGNVHVIASQALAAPTSAAVPLVCANCGGTDRVSDERFQAMMEAAGVPKDDS